MSDIILLPYNLLFEGGAASGAAAAGGGAEGGAAGNGADGQPAAAEPTAAPNAGEQQKPETVQETPEARLQRYKDMTRGDLRAEYEADINRIVTKRLSKPTAEIAAQKPIMDMLAIKYGTDDPAKITQMLEADGNLWEQQAQDAGFPSVDSFMQYKRMEREVQAIKDAQATEQTRLRAQGQVQHWLQQAEQMQSIYPGFDLQAEINANPKFLALLQVDIPVQHAYEILHRDEVMGKVAANSAAAAEKRITDNIRAKGMRPSEGGAAAGTAVSVQSNVSALTASDRRALAERARRGEKVTFN